MPSGCRLASCSGLARLLGLAGVAVACHPLDDFRLGCGADCDEPPPGDGAGDGADDATDPTYADEGPPIAEGCSDLTREGYQNQSIYPRIAACAGGWSVPGVVGRIARTCDAQSGNNSANYDGIGCSAADLCGQGWHICRGRDEVAANAADGCALAIPPGTPDKQLLFVTAQPSAGGLSCSGASGDDDVFGCGNLGVALSPGHDCAPLNRALASSIDGTCSFNEAEPPLGPWQCPGGAGSAAHEGANLTKFGCTNQTCTWNGWPIGNSARGGVLCCQN